ncbi:MAG: hypothetical protein O9325_11590 [Roseomonas sp.]|nr:hypothetical protein [Roseomonas sp.]
MREQRAFGASREQRAFGASCEQRAFGASCEQRAFGASREQRAFGATRPNGRRRQCVTPQACLRHDAFEGDEDAPFVRLV